MFNKIRKQNEGFTIIEVLIVLAIAGLIMLIVFLAVPALQRNSRNTQRRNDISGLLGAVQEVLNNNNGDLTKISGATGATNVVTAAPVPAYYAYNGTASPVVTTGVTTGAGAQVNGTDTESISIRTGVKCSGVDAVAGNTRQIAIMYSVEPSTKVCTNS